MYIITGLLHRRSYRVIFKRRGYFIVYRLRLVKNQALST